MTDYGFNPLHTIYTEFTRLNNNTDTLPDRYTDKNNDNNRTTECMYDAIRYNYYNQQLHLWNDDLGLLNG